MRRKRGREEFPYEDEEMYIFHAYKMGHGKKSSKQGGYADASGRRL